jgi:hypothetical protein
LHCAYPQSVFVVMGIFSGKRHADQMEAAAPGHGSASTIVHTHTGERWFASSIGTLTKLAFPQSK